MASPDEQLAALQIKLESLEVVRDKHERDVAACRRLVEMFGADAGSGGEARRELVQLRSGIEQVEAAIDDVRREIEETRSLRAADRELAAKRNEPSVVATSSAASMTQSSDSSIQNQTTTTTTPLSNSSVLQTSDGYFVFDL
jgi:predicted  nucleic acid-binding Zn-ribbon protein